MLILRKTGKNGGNDSTEKHEILLFCLKINVACGDMNLILITHSISTAYH